MHELLPSVTVMALLVSPVVPRYAETTIRLSQAAADAVGLQLHVTRGVARLISMRYLILIKLRVARS